MLNKQGLKSDIKSLLGNMASIDAPEDSQGDAFDTLADGLANIIDAYIRSQSLTIPPGGITTAGSPTAQANNAIVTVQIN
ncbi:MAG: hypothetical protein AAFX87_24945 [Bacteroidota bacterium]